MKTGMNIHNLDCFHLTSQICSKPFWAEFLLTFQRMFYSVCLCLVMSI